MKKQALGRGLNALISTEEVKTYGSSRISRGLSSTKIN